MQNKKEAIDIRLNKLNVKTVSINIRGFDGPLVVHHWGEKAIKEMLGAQMSTKAKGPKEKKDPRKDFLSSLYFIGTGKEEKPRYGFPASAFKSAMVRATKLLKDTKQLKLDMIAAKQILFVCSDGQENKEISIDLPTGEKFTNILNTDLVEIFGEPTSRMDMVRLSNGSADIRFRAEFKKWNATLRIQYLPDVLDEETVANLLYRAGMTVGIGEGRPERGDMGWGRFEIVGGK